MTKMMEKGLRGLMDEMTIVGKLVLFEGGCDPH
jgi:hypothetical protein